MGPPSVGRGGKSVFLGWARGEPVQVTKALLCDRPRTRAFSRCLTVAFKSRQTCAARSSTRVEIRCVVPHTRGRDAPRLAFRAAPLRRGAVRVPP
jgi:hypothetical protein